MESLILNPATTALILIDLQNAIVGREIAPHSVTRAHLLFTL